MANWAYVENNKIVDIYYGLPKNWKNISGLHLSENSPEFLKTLNIYPIVENYDNYDSELHDIIGREYSFSEDSGSVIETLVLTEKPVITAEERKEQFLDILRTMRNQKLQESDWTQLPDVQSILTQEEIEAWNTYRTQLRSLPTIYSPIENEIIDLDLVQWPRMPGE